LFSLLVNIVLFFIFSRIFNFRFGLIEFVIYSVIYYPFMIMFYLVYGFIISSIKEINFDWVVE
ncbi:MAG: hypothetical protein ACP5QP_05745, partial [Brevinematia bacterium]